MGPRRGTLSPPGKPGLRLAGLAGLLSWAAHPPLGLWFLAWVALAPLFLSVTGAARFRQAAGRGYLYGLIFFGLIGYWVGTTVVHWTGSVIGWAAWFALTLVVACFFALWGGVAWWLAQNMSGGRRILAFAAAWTLLDWLRTLGSLSLPWVPLVNSQIAFRPLLQIADLTGSYGVTFLLLLGNGAAAHAWEQRGKPRALRWLVLSLALVGVVYGYGMMRLRAPQNGRPLVVAALQGNAAMRASMEERQQEWRTYVRLTLEARAAEPAPTLFLWPESGVPGDALYDPETNARLTALAQRSQSAHLVGSRVTDPNTRAPINGSVLITPEEAPPRYYAKRQIVPFGEYIPLRSSWPTFLSQAFAFFEDDLQRGPGPTVLRYADTRLGEVALGPFICYETVYPFCARQMAQAGANLLVAQTNDSWAESYAMMEQHYAAAVLRAIENRRYVVRPTNSGITCVLDACGREIAMAPVGKEAFVVATVRLQEGQTLYTRFGDWFLAFCALLLVALLAFAREPERGENTA